MSKLANTQFSQNSTCCRPFSLIFCCMVLVITQHTNHCLISSTLHRSLSQRREDEEGGWQEDHHPESKEGSSNSDDDSSGSTVSSGEGAPPIPLSLRPVLSEDPSLEGDDSQLDDLMFMLKTQNMPDEDDDDTTPFFPESPRKPTTSEHLELRRISIADTHL